MTHFENPAQLAASCGNPLGNSGWLVVSQDMMNRFADLTGDHQWIHVDVDRARRDAPGGSTIAHGYLLASLQGALQPQIYSVNCQSVIHYGIDRLRFLSPVPAGSRVRWSETVKDAQQITGGWRITTASTLEVEVGEAARPAYVADIIFLYYE